MSVELPYRTPDYPRVPKDGLVGREGPYCAHPGLVAAANAALAVDMPLLLTGEAGCGKTDFAFAAANALEGARPLECYVRSDSRAKDLLYHYDSIRRFGDAQFSRDSERALAGDPRPYIRLQPLGEALMSDRLRVVLIDEIDKAPRDLPNDLLRELDQGDFEIPEIPAGLASDGPIEVGRPETYRNQMRRPRRDLHPFVIITSNVERQLPDPFLRRCVFYHIPFPGEKQLRDIVLGRFPGSPMIERTLEIFSELREVSALTKRPSTSELIAWIRALGDVHESTAVVAALETFLKSGTAGRRDWSLVPGLGCLIKLREDQDRLLEPA